MNDFKWTVRTTFGLVIGALSPMILIPVTMLVLTYVQNYRFQQLMYHFQHSSISTSKILTLSIIPNLIWFYLFLNRERYEQAYGIIFGSLLYLPYVVYVTFFR